MAVQKATLFENGRAQRVLVDQDGRIYVPKIGWTSGFHPSQVVLERGGPYERWNDVPPVWVDGCPWWK